MEKRLYLLLCVYFLLGGIVQYLMLRRGRGEGRSNAWIKYFTYLLIVNLLFAAIYFESLYFSYLSVIIVAFSFTEIFSLSYRTGKYLSGAISVLLLIPVFFGFILFARMHQGYLFYMLFVVTVFDAFSQLTGQLAGRIKLFPSVSPAKTREGLVGGVLMALFTAIMLRNIIELSLTYSVVFGAGLIASAFAGDVFASVIKRKFGVKDFSNFIPGHGGFLDRFDSMMFASAFIYVFNRIVI